MKRRKEGTAENAKIAEKILLSALRDLRGSIRIVIP
jgi:hypothetical protein